MNSTRTALCAQPPRLPMRHTLLFALALVAASGCDRGVTRWELRVTYPDGSPVAGASVALDSQRLGLTGPDGQMDLGSAGEGVHDLEVLKSFDNGSITKTSETCSLSSSSKTSTVKMAAPVQFLPPVEVLASRVHLQWERSYDPEFREYKVYASLGSVFDETSLDAVLVCLNTAASKTDCVVEGGGAMGSIVEPRRTVYFRVFVLKSDTTMAGSAIIDVKIPNWDVTFSKRYLLTEERNFTGRGQVWGLSYDGTRLWVAYRGAQPDFYEPTDMSFVAYDPVTLAELSEFHYGAEYIKPSGMACAGNDLWVHFSEGTTGGNSYAKFDPSSGALTKKTASDYGGYSMAWNGANLLVTRYPQPQEINPETGAVIRSLTDPFAALSAGRRGHAVAYRPGEIWLSSRYSDEIAILDDSGTHVALANQPLSRLAIDPFNGENMGHMVFVGDRLFASDSFGVRLYAYTVTPQ